MDYRVGEVEYIFNYDSGFKGPFSDKRYFGIEPIQKTRVQYEPAHLAYEGLPEEQWVDDKFEDTYLNYAGTGAEFSTITANLIHEEVVIDTATEDKIHRVVYLGYHLPDVNQYAVGKYEYRHWFGDESEKLYLDFLPKLS